MSNVYYGRSAEQGRAFLPVSTSQRMSAQSLPPVYIVPLCGTLQSHDCLFCGEIPNAWMPESIILLCNTKQFASIHFILFLFICCLLQNYYLSLLSLLFSPLTLTAFVGIETNTSCCHLMPGTLQGKKDRTQQVSQKLSQYVRMKALGETLLALPFEKARFSQG